MYLYFADNSFFDYMGRADISDPKAVKFFYAGTLVRFRFTGNSLTAILNRTELYGCQWITAVIDDKVYTVKSDFADNDHDLAVNFADDLEDTVHTAYIVKRHETNERFIFKGVIVKNLLPPNFTDKLKIEVFGDSVCAGELTEAVGFEGHEDPENSNFAYDNVLNSFVMLAAKSLSARIHNNSQGGLALLDGTGWFHAPEYIGLESTFDKMCYTTELGEISAWDFTLYTPDIVIIEIAQNDSHDGVNDIFDLKFRGEEHYKLWTTKYKEIVRTLHGHYKTAKYIFTTTVLNHDKCWDEALEKIAEELTQEGIPCYKNTFENNGVLTPGHPRTAEQEKMACELKNFIGKLIYEN
ncbi:MAG: electron transporter RnfD [Ruminococcus sp.]|jgi:hypothetical protein|nr:electron transporter RnfD [Ruminococcus sp.]